MNPGAQSSAKFARWAGLSAIAVCAAFALARISAGNMPEHSGSPFAAAVDTALPYAAGETLHYRLGWASFANAADVQLSVIEPDQSSHGTNLHLRANLHSLPPLRNLFPVDDQFDSRSDVRTLESRQYEFHLDELGEKENHVSHLATVAAAHTLRPPRVIVPEGTRDPLGVLFAMRAVDWTHRPEFKTLMFDGHDVFEVRAHLEVRSELIAAASTNLRATRIDVRLFEHGVEVPKTALSIWFADDDKHTPVLMEAAMPYGNVRAELQAGGTR